MTRTRRGGVFVITLVVMVGLVAILAGASAEQRIEALARIHRLESARAEQIVQGAFQRAIAELAGAGTTTTGTTGAATTTYTTLQDNWAQLGNGGDENFVVGGGSFRIEIVDACSAVNLNTATEAQLQKLNLTDEQIACLLDFREPGQTPRALGAKDEYYNGLEVPYNAKLAPFETVDELLQVKGFTAKDLYEPVENVSNSSTAITGNQDDQPVLADLLTTDSASLAYTPEGQARQNINTANQQALQQRLQNPQLVLAIIQRRNQGTFTTLGQVLQVPGFNTQSAKALVNYFTIGNVQRQEGKINVNTATEEVLNSIPSLTPDVASAIVSRQSSGIQQLGDIFDIPGYSLQMAAQSIDAFTTESETFLVRVVAKVGSTELTRVGVVENNAGVWRLKRVEVPPTPNVAIDRWRWNETTSSETPLKVAS